jgi:Protein of unknown function (DUF2892)
LTRIRLYLSEARRHDLDAEEVAMFDKLFPANEHPIERVIRVALGLTVLSFAFVGPQTAWGFLGLIPILTGIVGSCPAYTLLGISTCPYKPSQKTT